MTIALRQRPLARVVAGIVRANDGALFDPSDLSTLYQDAAGTTPVTAVEQPVGLILDKSQGLELGLERVVNGDNEAGISAPPLNTLTNFTSKVQSSERAQSGNYSVKLTSNSTSAPHYWNLVSVSAGVSLKISGWVYIPAGTTANQPIKLVDIFDGSYTPVIASSFDQWVYFSAIRPAKATAWALAIGNNDAANWNGGSIYIDNLSVREIKGNHATQSVTASRPTLSARYNLLTKTEDFSDAVWAKYGTTASARTLNFSATNISRMVYAYSGSGDFTITAIFSPLDVGKKIRLSFWASGLDGLTVGGGLSPDLTIPDAGVVSYTRTGLTSVTNIGIVNSSDGLAKSVTLRDGFGVSLVLGTTPGPYQRVNTATDYDTDERYFKKYLRFDGVDDYLNLPYMGLYANGSASVVMGISRAKAGAVKYAITEGNPAGGKNYIPFRLSDTGVSSRIINDAGTVVVLTPESAGSASSLPEILSFKDTGNTLTLHKNSSQTNLTNYTRAGSLTLNNLTVGAIVQASVTENMLANLYSLIVTKSALSDAQRIKCERYAASKAGVIL